MQQQFDREVERAAMVVQLAQTSQEARDELIEEYRRRSEAAFAKETRRTYRQIITAFQRWCLEEGHDPSPPVPPRVIAAYVDFLGGRIRASTIETRLWALSELHRSHFQVNPCRHRLVELAL